MTLTQLTHRHPEENPLKEVDAPLAHQLVCRISIYCLQNHFFEDDRQMTLQRDLLQSQRRVARRVMRCLHRYYPCLNGLFRLCVEAPLDGCPSTLPILPDNVQQVSFYQGFLLRCYLQI